jgi:hypothetical protein
LAILPDAFAWHAVDDVKPAGQLVTGEFGFREVAHIVDRHADAGS